MPPTDEEAAMEAITRLNEPTAERVAAQEKIERIRVHHDPHVEIHELFGLYSTLYFRSLLLPRVEVLWSKRLTL